VFVTIFRDPDLNVNRVWPPYVVLQPGDEVIFKAVGTTATVSLPAGLFDDAMEVSQSPVGASRLRESAGTAASGVTPLSVRDGVSYSKATVKTGQLAGVHQYHVLCDGCEAVGNSVPVMIIEPPGP
jgi:hypothetical protein